MKAHIHVTFIIVYIKKNIHVHQKQTKIFFKKKNNEDQVIYMYKTHNNMSLIV